MLVGFGERADNTKIYGDILVIGSDKNIAGMHVGMEKVIPKHLGEKYLHATIRQYLQIHAFTLKPGHIAYRDAAYFLHHHRILAGVVPIDFGDVKHLGILKMTTDFRGIGGFPHQVQFVDNGFLELCHHFDRAQPTGIRQKTAGQLRQFIQQGKIRSNTLFDAGPQHLDHHLFTGMQTGSMDLGDGGRSQWSLVKFAENLKNWLS